MADAVVTIAGVTVPLSCFDMTPQTLSAVKGFRPFAEWAAAFKSTPEYAITAVVVQNIDWIASRIDAVKLTVEIQTVSKALLQEPVYLTSEPPTTAFILPVITAGERYVLVQQRPSLAAIGSNQYSPIAASLVGDELRFPDREDLRVAGITPSRQTLVPLGNTDKPYLCATEGSTERVAFFAWEAPAGDVDSGVFPLTFKERTYSLLSLQDLPGQLLGAASKDDLRDVNLTLAVLLLKKLLAKRGQETEQAQVEA
eukprot:RCo043991